VRLLAVCVPVFGVILCLVVLAARPVICGLAVMVRRGFVMAGSGVMARAGTCLAAFAPDLFVELVVVSRSRRFTSGASGLGVLF